jgi:large subunit ribosomal protein L25
MSHETPRIQAQPRERTGSRYARRLRRDGLLPAVVYGHKQDPVHVIVDEKTITGHLESGGHLLEVEHGGSIETCLIRDVQYDYLGTNLIHVDLARVDLNEEIEVSVPVVIKGRDVSPGAKAATAMVELLIADVEVICAAGNIPDEIVADISTVELNGTVTIADLKCPAGVRPTRNGGDIVVSIHLPKEEVEAPTEGVAAPEVLTERKPVEGAAAPEAGKKK